MIVDHIKIPAIPKEEICAFRALSKIPPGEMTIDQKILYTVLKRKINHSVETPRK